MTVLLQLVEVPLKEHAIEGASSRDLVAVVIRQELHMCQEAMRLTKGSCHKLLGQSYIDRELQAVVQSLAAHEV